MNKYLAALSATALFSLAPFALAASSTDLTVTGTITPSPCTPSLSNGGVVDYGKISAKTLNTGSATSLEPRTLNLDVSCDAATVFALHIFDNRPGSAAVSPTTTFGLGLINGTQKLGSYFLGMDKATADGATAQAIMSRDSGTTWQAQLLLRSDDYLAVAASDNWNVPVAARDITLELHVLPSIARTDGLDLSQEVALDGSATLEMKYL